MGKKISAFPKISRAAHNRRPLRVKNLTYNYLIYTLTSFSHKNISPRENWPRKKQTGLPGSINNRDDKGQEQKGLRASRGLPTGVCQGQWALDLTHYFLFHENRVGKPPIKKGNQAYHLDFPYVFEW
ncbi:hypothetical protein ACUUL3_04985 [Thiovibrio sp. JS02]